MKYTTEEQRTATREKILKVMSTVNWDHRVAMPNEQPATTTKHIDSIYSVHRCNLNCTHEAADTGLSTMDIFCKHCDNNLEWKEIFNKWVVTLKSWKASPCRTAEELK